MARSNTLETSWLKLIFQNIPIANIGDAIGLRGSSVAGDLYIALYTTDPTDTDSGVEATYTNYARAAVVRSSGGWTVSGNQAQNAAAITYPTSGGVNNTITHVGIRTSLTGGDLLYHAALSSSVSIVSGSTPKFNANEITITAN